MTTFSSILEKIERKRGQNSMNKIDEEEVVQSLGQSSVETSPIVSVPRQIVEIAKTANSKCDLAGIEAAVYAIRVTAPQSIEADLVMGIAANAYLSNQEAIKYLRKAVKKAPCDFDANFELGRVLYEEFQFSEAKYYFMRCQTILPENRDARQWAKVSDEMILLED